MLIPSIYGHGYAKSRLLDVGLADLYLRHTTVGDPLADAAVESLASFSSMQAHKFIHAGMERDAAGLRSVPAPLRAFFEEIDTPPAWFDPEAVRPACYAFHRDSDLFIGGLVLGVLTVGFSTLISKSFFETGRLTEFGVRRLQQNTRHLIEITLPGGLDRQGEGWKLSVRIRLVHAQCRRLLREGGSEASGWDESVYGMPLSLAHIALAYTAFSALQLAATVRLGASLSSDARKGYMHLWRYVGHLFGLPPALLFDDEAAALAFNAIGMACEPPPDLESIVMANSLIAQSPIVAGVHDPAEQAHMRKDLYRISRALIGHEMANRLRFPKYRTRGVLSSLRWRRSAWSLLEGRSKYLVQRRRLTNFSLLLSKSIEDDLGISYRLPDRLQAEQASKW